MDPPPTSTRLDEHVGELKVTLEAGSLEDLFAEAARFVSRECGPVEDRPGPWEELRLAARDPATLLVDWLNELIGRSEVENVAYGEVRNLRMRDSTLEAEIRGRPVRSWESALKAATYHGLELGPIDGRWRAVVLLDV